MIQPYLSHTSWTYTSVYGLIWLNSGLKLPTNLEEKACNALIKMYREVNTEQPLVIDFRNIKDVADRALENLFKVFQDNSREVLLLNYDNISDAIDKNTHDHYKKGSVIHTLRDGQFCRIFNNVILTSDIGEKVEELRKNKVADFVKSCFIKFDQEQYLTSTPLKATGIFDAAKLISNHTAFYWICLQLSDMLKSLLNSGKISLNKELRILTVNLKSSPFASVVSLLNKIPLVTIDHLGPKHKVYDLDILDGLENLKQYSYIYIGDFCVGGTEIKIAKTYAGISNSELNTALVIGGYFQPDIFLPVFNLHSLVNINNLHPQAKFSI